MDEEAVRAEEMPAEGEAKEKPALYSTEPGNVSGGQAQEAEK